MAYLVLSLPPIAMAIAMTKARWVRLFFMHLRHAGPMMRLFALVGLWLLAVPLMLTSADAAKRSG